MPTDRLPCAEIRPPWTRFSAGMRIRYLSHPALKVAFIQSVDEVGMVYVVSDDRLPETLDEAAAIVAAWREENGRSETL